MSLPHLAAFKTLPLSARHQLASESAAALYKIDKASPDDSRATCQGLLELAVGSPDPLQPSPLVDLLLKLLQALLAHGLLSHAHSVQHTWTSMLPSRQASAFDVLQVSCCCTWGRGNTLLAASQALPLPAAL